MILPILLSQFVNLPFFGITELRDVRNEYYLHIRRFPMAPRGSNTEPGKPLHRFDECYTDPGIIGGAQTELRLA